MLINFVPIRGLQKKKKGELFLEYSWLQHYKKLDDEERVEKANKDCCVLFDKLLLPKNAIAKMYLKDDSTERMIWQPYTTVIIYLFQLSTKLALRWKMQMQFSLNVWHHIKKTLI